MNYSTELIEISANLNDLWLMLQSCSEKLRAKCNEAQITLRLAQEHTDNNKEAKNNPTTIPISSIGALEINSQPRGLQDIWTEWKYGINGGPPIEHLNAHYGRRVWTQQLDPESAMQVLFCGIIIDEMEYHLAQGRDLAEVVVAGNSILARCGSFKGLAQLIQANQSNRMQTFFDPHFGGSD